VNTTFCHTHGWAHDAPPDDLSCRTEDWTTLPGTVISSVEIPDDEPPRVHLIETGSLAYLCTAHGLVPVKVTRADDEHTQVEVTADRPGYDRGEVLNLANPTINLLHRGQVARRSGTIRGTVRILTDEGNILR